MSAALLDPALAVPGQRPRGRTGRGLAAGVLGTVLLFAIVGPLVLADPAAQDLGRYLQGPSWDEPLGRDDYGRSVLSRLAHATRLSLALAGLCVLTALVLGTAAGVASAWLGGWVDAILRGVSEAFVAIPALLVVLLVSALAAGGDLWGLYLGLALAQWVEYFRMVRVRAGAVLASPAAEAARLLGLGPGHLVRRHLWPDLRSLLATLASLGMVTSILAMSTLGFVKVGLQPPRAELGLMITDSFAFYDVAPWMCLAPIGVLFVLTLCFLGLRSREEEA